MFLPCSLGGAVTTALLSAGMQLAPVAAVPALPQAVTPVLSQSLPVPLRPGVGKEPPSPLTKGPPVAKVKECCGYPLSAPRGFKISFYWLAWESEYANEVYDTEIYTRDGFYLGKFPRTFVYELRLEGSGILRDGRVINYDGDCRYGVGTCFKTVEQREHPLGMGGQYRPLQAFRSVAIDPRYIPIGTPLYLPQLVGIRLPDGTRHDGCVRADDTGGGIRKREIDFFVESYANYKYIADNMWWDMGVTPLVEEPRCAYLRQGDPSQERHNERTDWVALHNHPVKAVAAAKGKGKVTVAHKGQKKAAASGKSATLALAHRPGYKGERAGAARKRSL